MGTTVEKRPRLKNLDDLFELDKVVDSPDNAPQQNGIGNNPITSIDIGLAVPYPGHPFRLYEGERLDDMVESIRKNGVLVPIIARKAGLKYEILSGHNRVNASKLAGLSQVPAIIKEGLSDEEAWAYVIETNLMQRSFSDMSHSEKAAVLAMQHSKLFSQGKRNDILKELENLNNSCTPNGSQTSSQIAKGLTSIEKVGGEYGLSKDTVARYLRVDKLTDSLKLRLDNGEIPFIASVNLSYLTEDQQLALNNCINLNGFKVDLTKADLLRNYSEKGKLNEETIYTILTGEIKETSRKKPNRTPTVKVKKAVYAKYFTPDQSQTEIQGIVEKALDMYFSA